MPELPEAEIAQVLNDKKATVAVAESCTGGLISHRITNIPGSSGYFDRGVIAYSNRTKTELLSVSEQMLKDYGAVSPETAMAMARGIRKAADATFGIAVTGIAGPGGGTPEKPVGLVYIAIAGPKGIESRGFRFDGDRLDVKGKTADEALSWLLSEAKRL